MAEAKKKASVKASNKDAATEVAASEEIAQDAVETVESTETEEVIMEKSTAKAGKRSAKAIAEAEAKEEKEARKAAQVEDESEPKPKAPVTPTRSRLERRGKKFRKAAEAIQKDKFYTVAEAATLIGKTSPVSFDATVELHVNLNVDPRHADQNIRDNLVLPAGTGKSVRVAVFADDAAEGADIHGVEEILKQLDKGTIGFDILIATPANMAKLGKYARVLGPRGLMPNPKSGTVTTDVAKAVQQAKAGRVEYRVDSTGIVHVGVGKVSFTPAQIQENIQAVLASIKSNKPASVKGTYLKSAHVTTTMGPSLKIQYQES